MKHYSIYPRELFWSAWEHRSLIWRMAKREVIGRYKGSMLGLGWSFFNPILMLVIYTFVFSVVFKARWGVGGTESTMRSKQLYPFLHRSIGICAFMSIVKISPLSNSY